MLTVIADRRAPTRVRVARDPNGVLESPDGRRPAFQRGRVVDDAMGTGILVADHRGQHPRVVLGDPQLDTLVRSGPTGA